MIKIKWILIIMLFYTASILPGTIYYVSPKGNDSKPGTDPKQAWQTINKVNSMDFQPGDIIKFECGYSWIGEQLKITQSGVPHNRIVYTSYAGDHGDAKPIISMEYAIPGTNVSGNWSLYKTNTWKCNVQINLGHRPYMLWDHNYNSLGDYGGDNGNLTPIANWTISSGYLYVYSTSNPYQQYYISNDFANGLYDETRYTVLIKNANYITLNGLDLRFGGVTLRAEQCDSLTIKNCNIGWGTDGYGASILASDNGIFENNFVDNGATFKLSYVGEDYVYTASDGLSLGGGNHWKIHDNYFKDWYHAGLFMGGGPNSIGFGPEITNYNEIYDNYFTSPDISYGRGMGVVEVDNGIGYFSYNRFYRNIIHKCPTQNQFGGDHNYFYYNIIDSVIAQPNTRSGNTYGLFTAGGSGEPLQNCYIFNNTFYYTNRASIAQDHGDRNYYYNNLFLEPSQPSPNDVGRGLIAFDLTGGTNTDIQYNLIYSSGRTLSDNMVSLYNSKGYTIAAAESQSPDSYGNSFSNNTQIDGTSHSISYIINNSDFTLPSGSPALNEGVDISSLVPEGFTDINGNLVNRSKPNIGAVDNISQESTGLIVFLEGPYKNGQMSTLLYNNGSIPKTQPYNVSPWNYSGSEAVSSIPPNIVDWVLVELRTSTSPSSIIARKAAFLRDDGSITALDGVSPLKFDNSLSGKYYIVIKHRNHLSVMSSKTVKLTNSTIQYDFTTSKSQAYGQNSMINLGNNVYGMIGGDINSDGIIDEKDVEEVSQKLFSSGYIDEDSDMNFPVNVLDYKLPKINMSKSTQVQ